MSRVASIDGVIHRPEEARVSVYDRGFLYGDSVFETIRTYRGRPFALDEHLARLERSATMVAIPMPVPRDTIAAEVEAALVAGKNAESYARVMLSRGVAPLGLDPSQALSPVRVILVEPLEPPSRDAYRDGVACTVVRTERAADAAHGAKVGNYLASLLALRAAKAAGAHEALIVDGHGRVVEGATSNVFLVRAGVLVTPPEEANILPGITRAHLLEVARAEHIPVALETFTAEQLIKADEAFLSSSIREVLSVVRVEGQPVGSGVPGPVTRRLHAAFRAHVGLAGAPMPWQ
jgi:branched-chain amino acid aminotransferase